MGKSLSELQGEYYNACAANMELLDLRLKSISVKSLEELNTMIKDRIIALEEKRNALHAEIMQAITGGQS